MSLRPQTVPSVPEETARIARAAFPKANERMKRKYDVEFKRNTVQKVFDGQSVASVSRELGVGEGLIHKWKKGSFTKW